MRNYGMKLRTPISKIKEEALLQAHREGREFASRTSATLQDAKRQAKLSFTAKDEQDVFIAGFHGECKRRAKET
jgi:hypothetical protein